MTIVAYDGPVFSFGVSQNDVNQDRGPSLFDQGTALMDPRSPFNYKPGGTATTYGLLSTSVIAVDAVPSTIAAANIAASQTPGAGVHTLTLVSSSGAGITVGTSITNAATGATVTGLLAIDTAMAPVTFGDSAAVSIWNPAKAIARNVRITSGGNDSGITFTVSGYDVYGYAMTETITGANAGVAAGAKAFKYIASVVSSGDVATTVSVGTGDVYGLPVRADTFGYVRIFWNSAAITASTGFTAAVTTSPATATTGDVRGTYATQSASDGSKRLTIFISPSVANISSTTGLFGVTQA